MYRLIEKLNAEMEKLRERAEKAERERDEARANYAFMVERAADQKLDGYRELGARAAAAEERAEKAERERDEARDALRTERRLRDMDVAKALAERDERAERVGRAVLHWMADETPQSLQNDSARMAKRGLPAYALLLASIADAMGEP